MCTIMSYVMLSFKKHVTNKISQITRRWYVSTISQVLRLKSPNGALYAKVSTCLREALPQFGHNDPFSPVASTVYVTELHHWAASSVPSRASWRTCEKD